MKTASILALVVVLGLVREAFGYPQNWGDAYVITVNGNVLGIYDALNVAQDPSVIITVLHLGPFGSHQVPFTATQGFIGFCLILAPLVIVPVVLTVRWKKKRVAA